MRKLNPVKVFVGIFCAICVCFTFAVVLRNVFSQYRHGQDLDNSTQKVRDENGDLVFLETRVDGLLQGRVFYKCDGKTMEGEFDADVMVGKWESRYSNGALMSKAKYSPMITVTNSYGYVTMRSDLIFQNDYDISGNLVGFVTNNFGVMVTMDDDGRDVAEICTLGYPTNVTVRYADDNVRGGRRIREVLATEQKGWDKSGSAFFHCSVDADGRIRFVREGKRFASQLNGSMDGAADSDTPLFLLGESTYIIPELINAKPVFNQLISCTNETLVITPIQSE